MNSQLFFTTKSKNKYLFDYNKNTCLLVPPWQEFIKDGKISGEFMAKDQKEIEYYHKKYSFLKQHGWYKDFDFKENIAKEIAPDDIKNLSRFIFQCDAENYKSYNHVITNEAVFNVYSI